MTVNGPEKWNTTGTFDNLQPGTEYTFITRMVYDENEAMPSQNSAELKLSTKATVPAAPAAPVMESRTDTEIRLKGADQQQYALVPADGTTYQWQDSPIFTSLQAGTEYSFVTRIKENGNVPASAISQPVKVKTKLAAAAAPAAPELQDQGEGFKRDASLTAPKTGDDKPILILLGIVTLSAMVIVFILALRRRQKKNAG